MCALAALVAGEQHPLLTVIAEHSVALLAVIRAIVERQRQRPPDRPSRRMPAATAERPPRVTSRRRPGPGRYQHIPVTVEE